MKTYKLVALLPIKANSERVPGKNFRNFAGRPLYRWILDTLLSIEAIERVVINTDVPEFLKSQGLPADQRIEVRMRLPELCGDYISMNRILEDDILAIESEMYLMTHTTNPLIGADTIKKACGEFDHKKRDGYDSLFSVNRLQTRFYTAAAEPINHCPSDLLPTQELQPWYEENSNLYLFSRESFATTNARIGKRPLLFETPRLESADIDDENGWHLAEIIALCGLIGESKRRHSGTKSEG
jgi:CMP-N-acetylneuraminic acid synthetase